MKQLELDSIIGGWYRAKDAAKDTARAAETAQTRFINETLNVAKRLLPEKADPSERWIFPSTDGHIVVAFLKKKISYGVPSGEEHISYEPTVEEHPVRSSKEA